MKVRYVITDSITPVVESQVLENIVNLRNSSLDVGLIMFLRPRLFFQYRKKRDYIKKKYPDIPLIVLLHPFLTKRFGWLLGATYLSFYSIINRKHSVIFHCRGFCSAYIATKIKHYFTNVLTIYDVRGDSIAEGRYAGVSKDELKSATEKEMFNLQNVDFTLYVSEYLKKSLYSRYGVSKNNQSKVIYCTASNEKISFRKNKREQIRKELDINNKLVFVYSGSVGTWHCIDEVIIVCRTLSTIYKEAYFLFLTNQPKIVLEKLDNYEDELSSVVMKVEPSQVGDYLSAADVGVIIREPHQLNYASSPVKVAEYILNGLPLIISESVKDYAGFVSSADNGQVLNWSTVSDQVDLKNKLSEKQAEQWFLARNTYPLYIRERLSKTKSISKLEDIYNEILSPRK